MELKDIKGLGKKRIEYLEEKGITEAKELAFYFPKSYFDLESKDIFMQDGKYKLIKAEVVGEPKVCRIKKNFGYTFAPCVDQANTPFKAIWYNQPYIAKAISNGDILFLHGKSSLTKKGYFVVSTYKNQNKLGSQTGLIPIYKSNKNLNQSAIASAISQVLETEKIDGLISEETQQKYFDLSLLSALKIIHNPPSVSSLAKAKERIDIESSLPIIKINKELEKCKIRDKNIKYCSFDDVFAKFCSFLPYNLTNEQKQALEDIKRDLQSNKLMSRLIQGDVGSGKTIIALIVCALILKSGYSAMIMAPTEILAKQHFDEAMKYFPSLSLDVCLLTSSLPIQEKNMAIRKINSNSPVLAIGTQSLLSEKIDHSNIALLVIDEQHRFGVKQRSQIIKQSRSCDLLMLSATPIPRSLALVYYGGLDVSMLSHPPKEKNIQTNIVSQNKEEDMWNFVEEKINSGSKVYVVCANIDDMDDDCYQGLSAESMYKFLSKRFLSRVVLTHGRLDSKESQRALASLKNGDAKILVSTTIIEVGIDIKEADIMIIVSPEKFGLATLHQLRGRIGRAGQKSYCFCLAKNLKEQSLERIKYFKDHSNGFEIAEYDYNSRGSGEILSTKQHGKIDQPFDLISLASIKKASEIYDRLESDYKDTNFLIADKKFEELSKIGLN